MVLPGQLLAALVVPAGVLADSGFFAPGEKMIARCFCERTAAEANMLERTERWLRAFHPNGFKCSIHTDLEARWAEDHCGPWYRGQNREPFPAGFIASDGQRIAWPIVLSPDGRWRAIVGTLCGYYIDQGQVDSLVQEQGYQVATDELSGRTVLVDADGQIPLLPIDTWRGECVGTGCGLCCLSPRLTTRQPCAALESNG